MASSSSPSQTRSSQSAEDLWEAALGKLKTEHKSQLRITRTDRLEILEQVLSLVEKTEHVCQSKRWKWKNKKGEFVIVRDIFTKMVAWIEKFKGTCDNIVQYDPGHAALPWAAVRLVLQAAVNDVQTNRAMVEGLELVFNLIVKFEVIERLYLKRQSTLQAGLKRSLVALYASVLEYLVEAQRYFEQGTIVRIAKSIVHLEEMTTRYTKDIKKKSEMVEEHVRFISGEIISSTDNRLSQMECSDEELRNLRKILKDLNEPITRIATKFSHIEDNLQKEERLKIFEWLSTVPIKSYHRSKAKILLPGSGAWLLRKHEFVKWMSSSSSSILWLHGIPGSGKSMLVAHVIEYIQGRVKVEDEQTSLAYFYCARNANEPERQDPVELFRSIVEQLSCSNEDLPIRLPVLDAYIERKKEARGRRPERLDLDDCVKITLKLLDTNPATIVIDGLDECDPTRRQNILDALRDIIRDSNNVVKVFVSSRDDHDLVHRLSQTPNLYIQAADNMEDIRKFVVSSVGEAISKERILCGEVSPDLRRTIIDTLILRAKGMFRLVSLHIDSLCNPARIKTRASVLDSLEHLPADLKLSYNTILTQISHTQHPNPLVAERVLKWLLCAREPLRSKTFLVAVCSDMTDQELLQCPDILSICCNLVIYDGETDRFQFAHLSVREHLEHLDSYSTMKANALAAEQCLSWFFTIEKYKHDRSRLLMFDESLEKSRHDSSHLPTLAEPFKKYKHDRSRFATSVNGWSRDPTFDEFFEKLKHDWSHMVNKVFDGGSVPFSKEIRAGHVSLLDLECFREHADTNWTGYAQHAGQLRNQGRLQSLLQWFLLFDLGIPRHNGLAFAAWARRTYEAHFYRRQVSYLSPEPSYMSKFFFEHLSPDPLFVACTFDFSEIVTGLINGLAWNIGCGQAAVVGNSTASIEIILDSLAESQSIKPDYLMMLVIEAASLGHVRLLETLLNKGAKGLIQPEDLRRVIKGIHWQKKHRNKAALAALRIHFKTNPELTEGLLGIALRNLNLGDAIMKEVLQSRKSIYISLEVIRGILSQKNKHWTSMVILRWSRLIADMEAHIGARSLQRMHTIREIIRSAHQLDLPLMSDYILMLMHDMDGQLRVELEDLNVLSRLTRAHDYLILMIRWKAEITLAALRVFLSSWGEHTVRRVLDFHRVEITNDIIDAVASRKNKEEGKRIIELLLEKE